MDKFAAADLTIGQLNAIVEKLGGQEAALKFLRGELSVSEPTRNWREEDGGNVIVDSPRVISIDRSIPFDPKTFIGNGWSIEEQDERAIALTEIDLASVMFDSTLEKGETSIKGEDKLKRLKEKINRIRLDAGIFKTLWENQILIPEKWKERTNGNTTFITFDGTVLQNSNGFRYVLYLCWYDGGWRWHCIWLEGDWDASFPSAVLANSTLVSEALVS